MRKSVEAFCAGIGADPLLVQGAGGNASWKENGTLWVKASGTWLAEASEQDIFVPVELAPLRDAMAAGDFAVTPKTGAGSSLRPSIETLLHALMPHPVVLHLHAVEVLAHLVRADFPRAIAAGLGGSAIRWIGVEYHKPGAALAGAIAEQLARAPDTDVAMMGSHGLVIGGDDIGAVSGTLNALSRSFATAPRPFVQDAAKPTPAALAGLYESVPDLGIQQLALDQVLFARMARDWALYPDHVVFLGARPAAYDGTSDFLTANPEQSAWPELLYLRGTGVFMRAGLSRAKLVQLRCYYDVLTRQLPGSALHSLTLEQVADLLDWDAEKYRMSLSQP